MTLLQNRHGLILGIANERSLAFGIARAAHAHGASLTLTYQSERVKEPVSRLATLLGGDAALRCDVTQEQDVAAVMQSVAAKMGRLDFVVHAVAAARREELEGRFIATSRDGFALALDVSVYSLISVVRAATPLLLKAPAPAVLTLSYYGGEKAMPHYNVMGVAKAALEATVRYLAMDLGPQNIRVNAISPGPARTVSAAGIKGLRRMLTHVAQSAPLRRNVSLDDIGQAAVFAISDLSRGMTGEVYHIDSGYHALGAPGLGTHEEELNAP